MPNGASSESVPTVKQHCTNRKSGRIRKQPAQATTWAKLQVGEGKEVTPKGVFREDREKSKKVLKRTRDCDIIPTNPTYLPSKLQHLILTQTQRLLEECCYEFTEKWFPSMLKDNSWDAPEAVELPAWWKTLSKCDIPATAITLSHGQSLAVLFKRAISIRHCAVHRRPQIPIKEVEGMVRDAWSLSQALQDDSRAAQLLHWQRELENLVAHLKLRTNSQREAAEAELRNIHNAKVEIEERLAELELRASQLTQSLEMEGRTHRPIDVEALQPLEEALSRPALAKALHSSTQDQIWQWIQNSVGAIIHPKQGEAPKRVTVKVEPQGLSPRDQPLLRSPVLVSNVLHDSYENSYGYMCERDLLHKRRKKIREADETFEGLDQDSQFTTRPTTLRRTAIQGHETSRLAPDMQTRVKNEMARHVRPSAGQLQPYPPNPFSTDGDDKSTDYGSVPADYEWE